jgi:hypothetical protein
MRVLLSTYGTCGDAEPVLGTVGERAADRVRVNHGIVGPGTLLIVVEGGFHD